MDRPGRFKVSAEIAAEASGKFVVIVGEQKVEGTAPATQDSTKFKRINLAGTLDLAAGSTALKVKPVPEGWQPMNLRGVLLMPVEQ